MILDVNRVEKKYLVDPVITSVLKQRLSIYMKSDSHNGMDGYMVRSVYFDSLYDRDFREKIDGLDDRKKIRLRVYSAKDENAKLEWKEKHNGMQRKRSLLLTKDEAGALIRGDYTCLRDRKEPLATLFYTTMMMDVYRPKCMVEYDRYAFVLDENDTRITFDSNLRASEVEFDLFKENPILYPVCDRSSITLEVKYNRFLMSNVKKALSKQSGSTLSNSKYVRARMVSKRGIT